MARKLAALHGLGDDDLIVSRVGSRGAAEPAVLPAGGARGRRRDLAVSDGPDDVGEAFAWLRENAEPVAACWIEPRAATSEVPGTT